MRPSVMPSDQPVLYLTWNLSETPRACNVYRYAQRLLITDASLELPRGDLAHVDGDLERPPTGITSDAVRKKLLYAGKGLFAGRSWNVECCETGTGYQVTVEGRSGFRVSGDGCEIHRTRCSDSYLDREVLLGPVMTLALALQGLFTLHLSAVRTGGGAVCFLGESGAGKSTAAEYLAINLPGAVRVADDMAPFVLDGGLKLIRGLPQPKLGCEQHVYGETEPLSVRLLVWLEAPEADEEGIARLGSRSIVRRLAASTVGTRLFDEGLLRRHFLFCTAAAAGSAGYVAKLSKNRNTLEQLKTLAE